MPDRDIEMRARARDVVREVVGLRMRNDAHISFEDAVSACLAFAATSAATADGVGFVYWNPDAGEEYASSHPIDSGECVEAENIRRSTGQEDALHAAFQEQWQKAAALSASPLPGREEIARCIEIVREIRDGFLSEEYAVDQPMSSFLERFACEQAATAIENEFAMGTDEQCRLLGKPTPIEQYRASLSTPPTEG